jgi:hypothetical protein
MPSLKGFRCASRDNPDAISTHDPRHEQHASVDHTDGHVSFLAIPSTIIDSLDRKWIIEYPPCDIERNAVLGQIRRGLCLVPFETGILHSTGFQ